MVGAVKQKPVDAYNAPGVSTLLTDPQVGADPNGDYSYINNYNAINDAVHHLPPWSDQLGDKHDIDVTTTLPDWQIAMLAGIALANPAFAMAIAFGLYKLDQHSIDNLFNVVGSDLNCVYDEIQITPPIPTGTELSWEQYVNELANPNGILAQDNIIHATSENNTATDALGGSDTVYGGDGGDLIWGDLLYTSMEPGADTLYGEAGNDVLDGGQGNDYLDGGTQDDLIYGGTGDDVVFGGTGDDTAQGGAGKDYISMDVGDDVAQGGRDNDYLDGGDGNDILVGGGDDDYLVGGKDNDFLFGDQYSGVNAAYVGLVWLDEGATNEVDTSDAVLKLDVTTTTNYVMPTNLDAYAFTIVPTQQILVQETIDLTTQYNGTITYTINPFVSSGYAAATPAPLILYNEDGTEFSRIDPYNPSEADGNDFLDGGDGNDVLVGGGGMDVLLGGKDDDYLDGGNDADTLSGDDGMDTLLGQDGEDVLVGGAGNDFLFGGLGNDFLYGGGDNDLLMGEQGDDVIIGGDGRDVATGGAGQDILDGGAQNDELYGQSGNDTVSGGAGDDYLSGGEGNDNLDGGDGNDILQGGSGQDVLSGGNGNDVLSGDDGDDVLLGGAGDDALSGSDGDILIGGAGRDTYSVGTGHATVIDSDSGNEIQLSSPATLTESGDLVTFTLDSGDSITVNRNNVDLVNIQTGAGGEAPVTHSIEGLLAGEGVMLFGSDIITLPANALNGTQKNDTLNSSHLGETLNGNGGDDVLNGNAGDDELSGGTGYDQLFGGDGNDVLAGGAGYDQLSGGTGDDIYEFNRGDGVDVITETAQLVYENDEWIGSGGYDVIRFGAGIRPEDLQLSYVSNDLHIKIDGSDDELVIAGWVNGLPNSPSPIERFEFTDPSVTDGALMNELVNQRGNGLEGIFVNDTGTAGSDALFGLTDSDVLNGAGGSDVLTGNDGNDVLIGGAGDDYLSGGNGSDTYVFESGFGHDIIAQEKDSANATLNRVKFGAGIAAADVSYSLGTGGALVLTAGSDTLTILDWSQAWKTYQFEFSDGSILPPPRQMFEDLGGRSYGSVTPGDVITGTAGNNVLWSADNFGDHTFYGLAGDDLIEGGQGNDTLDGGSGNDYYNGNGGADTYVFGLGYGQDTISYQAGETGLVERVNITGGVTANDIVLVRDYDNLVLQISGTSDTLTVENWFSDLGKQDMEFVFADGSTLPDASAIVAALPNISIGTEADDSLGALSYEMNNVLLGMGGNDLLDAGSGNDRLDGGAGNDMLTGRSGDDLLSGGDGDDQLYGDRELYSDADAGYGNDVLDGGAGNDFLHGGRGNDTYIFGVGYGQDTINNFTVYDQYPGLFGDSKDKLVITGAVTANDVTFTRTADDLVIDLNNGADAITVQSWFVGPAYQIDTIEFANGEVLTSPQVDAMFGIIGAAPQVQATLADQVAAEDTAFVYHISENTFTDADTSVLALSAAQADGSPLPEWLHFDADSGTFYGVPTNGDVGTLQVAVSAADGSNKASDVFTLTVNNINDAPTVAQPVANQNAASGSAFNFQIPAHVFADVDAGDKLVYAAAGLGGAALPAWLTFDAATGTFSGTPQATDIGNVQVSVTATDAQGATVSSTFIVAVAEGAVVIEPHAPTVNLPIANQTAAEDAAFTFQVPAGTFADVDAGDSLTLSATLADGTPLPSWISFDAVTGIFSGTPANSDVDVIEINVTATDTSNLSTSSAFTLTTQNTNDAPVVLSAMVNQAATEDAVFTFQIPADTFTDIDAGDNLTLSATLSDDSALPSWISFNASTGTFSGTPLNGNVGPIDIKVTAADSSGLSVSNTFTVTTQNTNDAPVVSSPIANQTIAANSAFTLAVAGSFSDIDVGDVLTYSLVTTDGSALPSWLSYNAATGVIEGTPGVADVGTLNLIVMATDTSGALATQPFVVDINAPNGAVIGTAGNDSYAGTAANDLYYGGAGNDIINGAGGNDTLLGQAGNDTINGGAGSDTMYGGAGNDTYVVDNSGDVVVELPNGGTDTVQSSITFTLGSNVENLTLQGASAINGAGNELSNILLGNSANNILTGGAGNDVINGGAGSDSMIGGSGDDSYVVDVAGDVVNENTDEGIDTVSAVITYTLGNNVENLVLAGAVAINGTGNALNNMLTGNSGNNILTGGAGDDLLIGGAGADTLRGGSGNDVYEVDVATDVVTENANEGTDTVNSFVTLTLAANIENLTLLGSGNSNATGNTLNNVLIGNSGNNTLNGATGSDVMSGGAGNDIYVVDNAADVVAENTGEGSDTVQSSVTYILGENVEALTLTGGTVINGTGNALDNTLTGNGANNVLAGGDGNDMLNGGAGNDTMLGGAGNDVYVVDVAGDVVAESVGEGTDLVQSSITYTLANNVENLTLTGGATINGTGNILDNILIGNGAANVLTGGAGNDTLNGGAGADTLRGGTGDDRYVVDSTGDVVTENFSEGIDTVSSSISYTLGTNVENLVLTGTAAITGTGNALRNTIIGNSAANILTGGSGDDVLNGGAGADTLRGGTGNDLYVIDNAADVVTENFSEGIDTVQSSVTHTLAANVENLTLIGTSAINGMGNALNNTMAGNAANNVLFTGSGDDVILGGAGNDAVNGGAGNDTYQFGRGDDVDTVNQNDSGSTNDNALFGQDIACDQLWFEHSGNDLQVSVVGTGDKLVFSNWYLGAQYHVDQFKTSTGDSLLDAQVDALVSAMAAFAPPPVGQLALNDEQHAALDGVIAANWQ